jgi:hypothetical protein
VIIGARLSIRPRLALAALALLSFSLPVDAQAKKRRGRAQKIERRIDKAPSGAKGSPKPSATDEADDDDEDDTTARTPKPASADEDAGNDAASAAAGDGDVDGETRSERPRRRRARIRDDADAEVAATAEPAGAAGGGRWLELAVGARGFSRNLTYNDEVSPGLRQYQLAMGPAVVANIAFYPIALASSGPAAGIGIVADIEQSVATSSQLAADATFPNGATFPTSMHEFSGGIRYRIPVGSAQIGLAVTGGQHAFWFVSGGGADRNQLEIPNTAYQFARGGADVRLAVTPDFSIGAGAGYRHVLNQAGPVSKQFPHLTVAGVDVGVRAAYAFTSNIEARLQADVRRYFYDMHSVRGDALIAGGAVDQYLSVAFLLGLTLDRTP